jgi:cysteine desulfurase
VNPKFEIDDSSARYFDAGVTTPIGEAVRDAMIPFLEELFGDPNEPAEVCVQVSEKLALFREDIADMLDAEPNNLWFTAGGTESNNWVVHGVRGDGVPLCSEAAHLSVLKPIKAKHGVITPINEDGAIDLESLRENVRLGDVSLVSVQHANSETGVIQDIEAVSEICREHGVPLHVDAAISFGVVPLSLDSGADFVTLSSHKAWGPLGAGALVSSGRYPIEPWMLGGEQEDGMRAGPVNMAAIAGFHAAAKKLWEMSDEWKKVEKLRDRMENRIASELSEFYVNGSKKRLPNISSMTFIGRDSTMLSAVMEKQYGASVGLGGAGEAGTDSRVLKAMGLSKEDRESSVRVRLGPMTTRDDTNLLRVGLLHAASVDKSLSMA